MNKAGTKTNVDVNVLVEFFSFRIMLMPRIIIVLNVIVTILGVAALVCLPVAMLYFAATAGDERAERLSQCGMGFVGVLLGLIAIRLMFEYLILFFRINETLTELSWKNNETPFAQLSAASAAAVAGLPLHPPRLDLPEIPLTPPAPVYVPEALPYAQTDEIRPGDIVFDCPFCGHNHAISPKGAGVTVNCMKCGKPLIVPT